MQRTTQDKTEELRCRSSVYHTRYIPSILILAAACANLHMNLHPLKLFEFISGKHHLKKQTVNSAQFSISLHSNFRYANLQTRETYFSDYIGQKFVSKPIEKFF